MAQHIVAEVVGAGVDWLTLTAKANGSEVPFLNEWFDGAMEAAAAREGDSKQFAPQGYHGSATEHLFRGEGKLGWMFRASSDIADELARHCLARGVSVHPTRLDVCVDAKGSERGDTFAASARANIRYNERSNFRKRSVKLELIEGGSGGDTISVGSRRARRYFRIYDKYLQSGGAVDLGVLRWELECKREFAQAMFDRLAEVGDTSRVAVDTVYKYAKDKGLRPSWSDTAAPTRLPTSHKAAGDEKFQRWMIEQVAEWLKRHPDEEFKQRFLARAGFAEVRKRPNEAPQFLENYLPHMPQPKK